MVDRVLSVYLSLQSHREIHFYMRDKQDRLIAILTVCKANSILQIAYYLLTAEVRPSSLESVLLHMRLVSPGGFVARVTPDPVSSLIFFLQPRES
jgi:hypothetical protein